MQMLDTGIQNFAAFLAAGILLNLTPGPDTFYILARSTSEGRASGVAAAFGINAGSLVHTALAVAGISVLLQASPVAFVVLKLVGAAYLVWLGIGMLRQKAPASAQVDRSGIGVAASFRQGMLTNVLNPKVAIFFLAFVPQFVDGSAADAKAGVLLLSLTFVTTGTIWCLVLALVGAQLGRFLRSGPAATWLRRICGAAMLGFGVKLAFSRS
jgi:threonine/homoserine/homoserine lactone efflux protein